MADPLRALVVGYGSIARRHVRNLRTLAQGARIATLRRAPDSPPVGVEAVLTDWGQVSKFAPDVALVTSPATHHVKDALKALDVGAHVLIEKPLAASLSGLDRLRDTARQTDRVVLVAYPFRFYEPLQIVKDAIIGDAVGRILSARAEVGMYLPDWRPGIDYRTSVSAARSLGGGALLELSHEFDLIRWLVGDCEAVFAHCGRVSELEVDVEDIADVLLRFASGAHGSVHLDFLQRVPHRCLRIVGATGTIRWELEGDRAQLWQVATGTWTDLQTASVGRNDMYLNELSHFLECARGEASPAVSLEDGESALRIALAAHASAQTSQWTAP